MSNVVLNVATRLFCDTERKLFVGRISRHLTETDLISMFASFGAIEDCAIIRQPYTGLSAGYQLEFIINTGP